MPFPIPTGFRLVPAAGLQHVHGTLTFEQPDTGVSVTWPWLTKPFTAGGNMPCIVNAANEVVVAAFLHDRISFLGMSDVIEKTMRAYPSCRSPPMKTMWPRMPKRARIAEI